MMRILFLGSSDSPVFKFLKANETSVFQTDEKLNIEWIKEQNFDFLVSYGYRHIIKREILLFFPQRAINLHISLLPWNRGADPNFWSFVEHTPKGVSIHLIDEGIDTGDVLLQKEILFSPAETLKTSYDKLQNDIQKLFFDNWPKIKARQIIPQEQKSGGSSHRLIDKEKFSHLLAVKNWNTPVSELKRCDVIFRVDYSSRIGSGHLQRCLTLASEFSAGGYRVGFISRKLSANLSHLIAQNQFNLYELPEPKGRKENIEAEDYKAWLEVSEEQDIRETLNIISTLDRPFLIVDHYALGKTWEYAFRSQTSKIAVIDDLANRSHDCDFLIDQNFSLQLDSRYSELIPKNCETLLGPKFALLRREFLAAKKTTQRNFNEVNQILVFFGAADPTSETLKTAHALNALKEAGKHGRHLFILPEGHASRKELMQVASEIPGATVLDHVSNMAEVMAQSDLFIGSGGTSSWERCCLGLPSVVISVAPNQNPACEALAQNKCITYLGESKSVTSDALAKSILSACQNKTLREELSLNSSRLVDGIGAKRVYEQLTKNL